MTPSHDLHLSAVRIARATIPLLEELGFRRDEFANNTRCAASDYHATFRGPTPLPDDALWEQTCSLLQADGEFCGTLEEERLARRQQFANDPAVPAPPALPPIQITAVPAGKHKACDLHMSINLTPSPPAAVALLEHLEVASFDKPIPGGVRRVFTVTCATPHDGERMFAPLAAYLARIPGLHGQIKLEMTTRHLRRPADAPTLPLTSSDTVAAWLQRVTELH